VRPRFWRIIRALNDCVPSGASFLIPIIAQAITPRDDAR
jgi:hypothetical protein